MLTSSSQHTGLSIISCIDTNKFSIANPLSKFQDAMKLVHIFFSREAKAHFGTETSKRISDIAGLYTHAVIKCRQNLLGEALIDLNNADKLLEEFRDGAYLFAKLSHLSGWAFYYLLQGREDKAFSYTLEGLCISEYLEDYYKQSTLIYRRFEQHNNLATIYMKLGQIEKGAAIINGVVNLLLTNTSRNMYGGRWDKEFVNYIPYMKELALDAYICMAAKYILEFSIKNNLSEKYLYNLFLSEIPEIETTTQNRVILYNWIYLKNELYCSNKINFLNGCMKFLQEDIDVTFDTLKLSLVYNLLQIVRDDNQYLSLTTDLKLYVEKGIVHKPLKNLKELVLSNF